MPLPILSYGMIQNKKHVLYIAISSDKNAWAGDNIHYLLCGWLPDDRGQHGSVAAQV